MIVSIELAIERERIERTNISAQVVFFHLSNVVDLIQDLKTLRG